jgi:hypothetical protein
LNRKFATSLASLGLLLLCGGCLGDPKSSIVLVRERVAFQDPAADLRAMERRLSSAGAREIKVRTAGDTVAFAFRSDKDSAPNWRRILTRPGIFATTELVSAKRVPLFLTTLHLRFGREVDLHPELPEGAFAFASAALIAPDRKSEVDAALETVEFNSILAGKAIPAWGRMPGILDRGGVRREGADLFLLPPPAYRGGPITNDAIESAVFVPGADSAFAGVEIHLTRQGRTAYMELTQEQMGAYVAILVDDQVLGVEKVIQPVSSGAFWVPGCGTDCRNLAAILGGGAVRGKWRIVDR